ncbi:nuclear transport factor 2 family protein [Flavobacterium sp. Arc3]|uniref:nuclear transport factor 2 family protein n=1 Tax=Flavobacterium sp. Arc3 TaxID=3046686 RepID=UPI00352BF386
MTQNEKTITKFYNAFANGDATKMCECYHPNIQFRDPIFGALKGNDVCKMWEMLMAKSNGNENIKFSEVKADDYHGSALWEDTYNFSKNNREVVNKIRAEFFFQDDLIMRHTDDFDIWKWSKQALGLSGHLLGWTGYMQKKIHQNALQSLKKYQKSTL